MLKIAEMPYVSIFRLCNIIRSFTKRFPNTNRGERYTGANSIFLRWELTYTIIVLELFIDSLDGNTEQSNADSSSKRVIFSVHENVPE